MLAKIKEFINPVRNPFRQGGNGSRLRRLISNGVKSHQEEIILVIGVILISLLSFAVGFITCSTQQKEPLIIEEIKSP